MTCLDRLPYLDVECCLVCAQPIPKAGVCGQCLASPPNFDRTLAVFSYAYPIDALIRSLKYHGNLILAPMLGKILAESTKHVPRPDFLLPVPMHPHKLRQRGFNQAHEIAKIVSKKTKIPLIEAKKMRDTLAQTDLPYKERIKNIRGAFSCDRELANKHVAVVDDVMTTGATLNEMAKMLKKKGAVRVSAWVVARAVGSV